MKKTTFSTLIIAAAMALALGGTSRADDLKFPEAKDPAYKLSVAADWKHALDDAGNLLLNSADHCCDLSLSLIEDAATAKTSPDDLHALVFKAAGVTDDNKKEPDTIGGKPATAYYGTVNAPNGVSVKVKLSIVKLDDTHVATLTVVTNGNVTPDDLAQLKALLASIKFTAAK